MKAGSGSDGGGGDGGYDGRPMAVFFGRPGDSVRPDRFASPVEVSSPLSGDVSVPPQLPVSTSESF